MGEREFRFLLLEEEHAEILGPHAVKIPAIGQLVSGFRYQDQAKIIIDGEGSESDVKDISHIILSSTGVKHSIRFETQGDQHYPIVNTADSIARLIFRGYINQDEVNYGLLEYFKVPFVVPVLQEKTRTKYRRQRHRNTSY